MSEIDPSPEHAIYEDAAKFQDALISYGGNDELPETRAQLRGILTILNNSPLIGHDLRVQSEDNYIDWSYGQALNGEKVALMQTNETFAGKFIGYRAFPMINVLTGKVRPDLATLLSTTVYEEDVDHNAQVIVISPISTSYIELL